MLVLCINLKKKQKKPPLTFRNMDLSHVQDCPVDADDALLYIKGWPTVTIVTGLLYFYTKGVIYSKTLHFIICNLCRSIQRLRRLLRYIYCALFVGMKFISGPLTPYAGGDPTQRQRRCGKTTTPNRTPLYTSEKVKWMDPGT